MKCKLDKMSSLRNSCVVLMEPWPGFSWSSSSMCVFICYCDVNIRCKFIKIRGSWLNIFQSAVIYHSRRRQSNAMSKAKISVLWLLPV